MKSSEKTEKNTLVTNQGSLAEENEKLREIIEFLPDAAFVLDMEGKVLFWNRAAVEMTGTSKEMIIGTTDYSLPFYKHQRKMVVDMFTVSDVEMSRYYENVRRKGDVINAETFIPHFNGGSGAYIWIAASPLVDSKGNRIGAIEVVRDISEQRGLMQTLYESENTFRQLTRHINEIFFLIDKGSRSFIYVSSAAEKLLGISPATILTMGVDLVSIIHPDDREQSLFAHPEKRYIETINEEFRIVRPDGKIKWLRLRTFPVCNELNEVIRVAGIASDITLYKEAEERERQHQQQLLQTDKMASLGILVSGVAHEINNPNNYITLSQSLLRKAWESIETLIEQHYHEMDPPPLEAPDFSTFKTDMEYLLTSVQEGSERIKTIVSDLKEFARGDSPDDKTILNLNDVVQAAVHLTGSSIRKATEAFMLSLAPEVVPVNGKFQRLEQVVINLIQNACDALTDKHQEIVVRTEVCSDKTVNLVVRDEGCGIPPENVSHLTDPFFTTKRDRGGTGLGLSVSAGIIDDHGGSISYSSIPGNGTEAKIILPAGEAA